MRNDGLSLTIVRRSRAPYQFVRNSRTGRIGAEMIVALSRFTIADVLAEAVRIAGP
jgi:hypothetical protein